MVSVAGVTACSKRGKTSVSDKWRKGGEGMKRQAKAAAYAAQNIIAWQATVATA